MCHWQYISSVLQIAHILNIKKIAHIPMKHVLIEHVILPLTLLIHSLLNNGHYQGSHVRDLEGKKRYHEYMYKYMYM